MPAGTKIKIQNEDLISLREGDVMGVVLSKGMKMLNKNLLKSIGSFCGFCPQRLRPCSWTGAEAIVLNGLEVDRPSLSTSD